MEIDNGVITDEIIREFPDLKRQEAVVFEIVKKVSLAYSLAYGGKNGSKEKC
jgi:hypothetical protein